MVAPGDLFDELRFGGGWVLEMEVEEFDDIVRGDERCFRGGQNAFLGDE